MKSIKYILGLSHLCQLALSCSPQAGKEAQPSVPVETHILKEGVQAADFNEFEFYNERFTRLLKLEELSVLVSKNTNMIGFYVQPSSCHFCADETQTYINERLEHIEGDVFIVHPSIDTTKASDEQSFMQALNEIEPGHIRHISVDAKTLSRMGLNLMENFEIVIENGQIVDLIKI